MDIVKQLDKRSRITYAYESVSHWDKEKKQSHATRKLIGRVYDATREIIATNGRCRTNLEEGEIKVRSARGHKPSLSVSRKFFWCHLLT